MPGKVTSTLILLTVTYGVLIFASLDLTPKILPEKNVPLVTAPIQWNSVVDTTKSSLSQNVTLNMNNLPVMETSANSQTFPLPADDLQSDNKIHTRPNLEEIERFPLTTKQVPTETKIKANIRKIIVGSKPQRIANTKSNADKDLMRSTAMAKPAKKKTSLDLQSIANEISSSFGKRIDPIRNTVKFHKGIDISRPPGTEVFAWSDGVISRSGWLRGYGLTVDVSHPDGMKTRYAHLMSTVVEKGQKIDKGQVVGQVGDTGRTTGPNLHFEVAVAGKITNPQNHLSEITEIVGGDRSTINNG